MIDWNKPIETVAGRKARLVKTHQQESWHIVWVEAEGAGDVYLVDAEGRRCDGASIKAGLNRYQFIRNAPSKREGWVLRRPLGGLEGGVVAALAVRYVFPTENEAKEAMKYYTLPDGVVPVRMQWEE